MDLWVFGAIALCVAGLFWVVRPDALAETSKRPASSIAFIKDRSGWVIGLCLGLLAVFTSLLAFQTDDSGFRFAILAFTVFGAAMASVECGRRLAHMRRIATG